MKKQMMPWAMKDAAPVKAIDTAKVEKVARAGKKPAKVPAGKKGWKA